MLRHLLGPKARYDALVSSNTAKDTKNKAGAKDQSDQWTKEQKRVY